MREQICCHSRVGISSAGVCVDGVTEGQSEVTEVKFCFRDYFLYGYILCLALSVNPNSSSASFFNSFTLHTNRCTARKPQPYLIA